MSQEDMIKAEAIAKKEEEQDAESIQAAIELGKMQYEIAELKKQVAAKKAAPKAAKEEEEAEEFVFVASNKKKTTDEQITESEKKVSSSNEGPDEDGFFVF